MAINSRATLIDYCMRALGYPVIQINVATEQIEDRIDDALDKFREYHADGTQVVYNLHTLTQTEYDGKYISISDKVASVLRIVPAGGLLTSVNTLPNMAYTEMIGNMLRSGDANLHSYTIALQYSSLLESYFNYEKGLRFNRNTNRLYVDTNWENYQVGDQFLIECYEFIDIQTYTKTYSDQWLRKYATALIKKQWGVNLSKYNGFQLPSGIVLDGRSILEDAKAEIELLEQELITDWALPLDVFVG